MAKILVVDDAETQRFQLKKDLEAAGYSVVEAHDGLDGLKVIENNPDILLVICDVNMPVMDGITMCSKVKETGKLPGIPIFMLTTEASAELKQTAKQFGVRAWITKPFVAVKLIEAVGKVVKR
jgi:CheY-like chemotaxis protein